MATAADFVLSIMGSTVDINAQKQKRKAPKLGRRDGSLDVEETIGDAVLVDKGMSNS